MNRETEYSQAVTPSQELQRERFDEVAKEYEAHSHDQYSVLYSDRFIKQFLFSGIPLAGTEVLDAACGTGEMTGYLLSKGARVTGLDISPEMIALFHNKFPDAVGVSRSIFSTGFADSSFDCVSIAGGLHHFHPEVQKAIEEVHRILRPGGHFCFAEPPSGTLVDIIRKVWYKYDSHFESNEASIDVKALLRDNKQRFSQVSRRYGGNVAYLFVSQSLHFRIPLWMKKIYAPFLMFLERIIGLIQPRWLSCFVICQWQKMDRTDGGEIKA